MSGGDDAATAATATAATATATEVRSCRSSVLKTLPGKFEKQFREGRKAPPRKDAKGYWGVRKELPGKQNVPSREPKSGTEEVSGIQVKSYRNTVVPRGNYCISVGF